MEFLVLTTYNAWEAGGGGGGRSREPPPGPPGERKLPPEHNSVQAQCNINV
jgi:hypothetical protein